MTPLTSSIRKPRTSDTITALAWPKAPTGLTATAVSTTRIDLSWTDDDTSQTGYTVERSEDGTTWTLVATINDPNTTVCSDTGRTEGTLYYYRVQATNAVGNSGYSFNAAAPLLATPTGLQLTAKSGSG